MKKTLDKLIVFLIALCLSLTCANMSFACECGGCCIWNGSRCVNVDSKCPGTCCKCVMCACERDNSLCIGAGCCSCSYPNCQCDGDSDAKCPPEKCCENCSCIEPMCDNCHTFSDTIYECHHWYDDPNGTPCSTIECIKNVMDTATCDYKGDDWPCGKSRCDTTLVDGLPCEVMQTVHDSPCTGGYVDWVTWKKLYYGCTHCYAMHWRKSCEVFWCEDDPIEGRGGPRGYKKKCGGCGF